MAYFSNGNEGMCFDEQCRECKYGEDPCPIFYVQCNYNYEACNNKTAREILDHLVHNNGTCAMFEMYKKDFQKVDDGQQSLFDVCHPEEKTFTCSCGLKFGNREAMLSHFKLHFY